MRLTLSFLVLSLTLVAMARADAVREPATVVRQWVVTASVTAAAVTFTSTTGVGGATIGTKSCHVRIINDGAAASPDAYVSLEKNSADIVAPVNGSSVYTIKAGESLGFDGEFWKVRYLSASATQTLRIIASFNQ